MEFLTEYGMFLAKLVTITIILAMAAGFIASIIMRGKTSEEEHLEIKNLNEKYENMSLALNSKILQKQQFKQLVKDRRRQQKKSKASPDERKYKLFVLNFKGDIKASNVSLLREEITAILNIADKKDEVFVKIESSGGAVHGYGLGASQLRRIRDKNIKLTVSIDQVAASGGYMMACVADRIIAAPFAIIGSIGVAAQLPNFNRLLQKHNIDIEELSAGKYKRTLKLFGKNKQQDRIKAQQELEKVHDMFKEFVQEFRSPIDIDKISTGEHWYGKQALELNLVDELCISDDYLLRTSAEAGIFEISYTRKKSISEKMLSFGMKLFKNINH